MLIFIYGGMVVLSGNLSYLLLTEKDRSKLYRLVQFLLSFIVFILINILFIKSIMK